MTREKEYITAMNLYPHDFKVTLKEMKEWFNNKPEDIKCFKEDMKEDIFTACIDFSIPVIIAKQLAVQF